MLLSPRYLPRLAALVGLFTRYGLKDFAQRQGLLELTPADAEAAEEGDGDIGERAVAFRKRLVQLGPAYVKLGQVLSTRADLLPQPYIEELEHLQDDVDPISYQDVEDVIEAELGGRISKLFASMDREPLGSASLGQVHAAELRDRRAVVVKVQRPGIREVLADDIEFFREAAKFMAEHTRVGSRVDMVGVIQQLERALSDELDYRIEARNSATFRRSLAQFPRLLVPRVIEAYSTQRVLTTERIRGVKIGDIPRLARLDHDFSPLADEFAKAYLKQITIDGHFHADPHPGNVFVVLSGQANPRTPSEVVAGERRNEPREPLTPLSRIEREAQQTAAPAPPGDEPKLALIDFGMTARLSDRMRQDIVRLLFDISENRGDAAGETLVEMGQALESFDRSAYIREIAELVARNFDRSVGEIQAGAVLYEMINTSYQHGLRLPAELTLLAKALFNLDAVSRALDPSFNPMEAIRDYANRIANERARRELSPSRLFQIATQTSDLMSALPRRIDLITQRMVANDFAVRVDTPQLEDLLDGMQKIANRVFSGLVLGGIVVASAMLYPHQRQLGTYGFLIAGAMGIYMVAMILLHDRKPKS